MPLTHMLNKRVSLKNRILLDIQHLFISLDIDGEEVPVVEDISFQLAPGRVLAIVGESGCGKSVTSQAILRLLPRELSIVAGEMNFWPEKEAPPIDLASLDKDSRAIREIRGNKIAMIFQEPMSSFSLLHTMGNQIGEVIRLHKKVSKHEAKEITIELLEKVGINEPSRSVEQYPYEFSGGMRQRGMIAKALACNPALLIADEPTTALDVTIQAQILGLMKSLQAEYGMAIIFITHDLGVVAQIADEVAIMYLGKIIEQGPVKEIFDNPSHPYTINLLNAIPRIGDLKVQRQLTPIQGTVPSLLDRPTGCNFHARCDSVIAGHCDRDAPSPTSLSNTHSVSCFLHEIETVRKITT
jgi:peptide/nickel transport system ATP-binding protein